MSATPDFLAQLQKRITDPMGATPPGGSINNDETTSDRNNTPSLLAAALKKRVAQPPPGSSEASTAPVSPGTSKHKVKAATRKQSDAVFEFDVERNAFLFFKDGDNPKNFVPKLKEDKYGNPDTDICIPLAPCAYRMTDYTFAKREPVALDKCLIKLGVLRCLQRECKVFNQLLWHRMSPPGTSSRNSTEDAPAMPSLDETDHPSTKLCSLGTLEEDELGKVRFMELLSNCGVYQKVLELILKQIGKVADFVAVDGSDPTNNNAWRIPQVHVEGLDEFLAKIEELTPALKQARDEIENDQTVSFFPGLGEFFTPGSKLLCHPEGMEGSPLGCSCVQSWYAEETNQATGKVKRRFVLVIEFIVSVGDELVFVAASDVYPEFHDTSRNMPIKDLTHRKLNNCEYDNALLDRLQRRGEFYASVGTKNHYLEYYSDSFFPIIGGGWSSNAVRPLSKGGRVMVDVKRGILENHIPVRSSDGYSDTVKEAIKLWEQSKRTGVAVPFRTCILPEFEDIYNVSYEPARGDSDRQQLWMSWPMLTGFSFTARVWGKLLLGLPKMKGGSSVKVEENAFTSSPRRAPSRKLGVQRAALGGEGSSGNCGYITFQEQAFEQLVLEEDKKELIRAVARNAGGGPKFDQLTALSEEYEDEDDDDSIEDAGIDVVANKGGASIFLLHGPPGCGKTLTAEAIAELLKKPLYIVTAGDLGTTAAEVEKTLGSVLDLCQTWDALVLIDEADIFLEARNSTEIQRNALVCVMLRLLEYYSGCLFLSSNRSASSIDAAIASRITVMLGYPPLGVEGRAKVWKNLVELVPATPNDPATGEASARISKNPRKASKYRVDFTEDDYQTLASGYELNGRQIKNSIVLARALSRERGMPLSMPILRRAVTAVAGEGAAVCSP
ncbi:phospholipid-translocating P-type ATPase, flippase [Nitzschia inconspicua]|uniref:Phospholipid-translocating P-type ATPase, flippase n=1 Tax=Nitzschia inconspicua TaxID=303405 RepID=A0A9K3Q3Y7_9STRA|nr:phospholipid-translocating P-type ATPase, flippase [Nitzschia inconspicua]